MTKGLARLHRPKADTIEISDLLVEAKLGRYELPDFQRDLEWKRDDRIKLFDSIYRGFPIGDILFWEPEEQRQGAVRFGPFSPETRQRNPLLIVDGQQRLATLFGCLLLPDRPNEEEEDDDDDDWRFAFHVDQGSIVPLPLNAPPELLPLPIAIDTSRYLKWARSLPEERRDERTQAADDFSKALRTYRIPFYVVRTPDRGLLQEVFERVNNTGKPLSMEDVFNALFPGDQGESIGLTAIVQDLEALGFGRLKPDWLLQAVKAMVGMNPALQFSAELRRMDEEDKAQTPGRTRAALHNIHPRLKSAAATAINLLQEAGLRRIEALPYALVLPPLIHFFDRFPLPGSGSAKKALHRFVWLVAVRGEGHEHRATYQQAIARIIRADRNADEVASRLVQYSEGELDLSQTDSFVDKHDWRSGATRLVELALFELQPREIDTGEPIPVWEVLPEKGHQLFRRIWTRDIGEFSSSSANRLISVTPGRNQKSSTLDQLIANPLFPPSLETLESQAITQEAWAALQQGNRLQFLKLRAARISEVVRNFMSKRLAASIA